MGVAQDDAGIDRMEERTLVPWSLYRIVVVLAVRVGMCSILCWVS